MEWIKVEDRLPELGSEVIMYEPDYGDSGTVESGMFSGGGFHDGIDYLEKNAVTHWMPLPEPPK